MKRKLTIAFAVASLLVLALVVTAMAQGAGPALGNQNAGENCPYGEFVDADNDGVCDNAGMGGAAGQGYRWSDEDATGNGQGMMAARHGAMHAGMGGRNGTFGQGYVDADDDGQCDNFVDADGDGQCDECAGMGQGGMQQRGAMQQGMQGRGRGTGSNR